MLFDYIGRWAGVELACTVKAEWFLTKTEQIRSEQIREEHTGSIRICLFVNLFGCLGHNKQNQNGNFGPENDLLSAYITFFPVHQWPF